MPYDISHNTTVMSAVGNHQNKDANKATFWKKNAKNVPGSIKPVYGAQYPPRFETGPPSMPTTPKKEAKPGMSHNDSFQNFQDSTQDAWDDADDDLMAMANIKMSLKDVHHTAMQVINQHSAEQKAKEDAEKEALRVRQQQLQEKVERLQHNQEGSPGSQNNVSPRQTQGPGVGVRLWQQSRPKTNVRYGPLPVQQDREGAKVEKFKSLLEAPSLDLDELKKITWSGIPTKYRPTAWKILSGYLPPSEERRSVVLTRKREEYHNFLKQYWGTRVDEPHKDTFRQIHIDIPRMSPLIPLFQQEVVQHLFERILFIWAIRHPASGYVQGINDLVTPFFVVFLTEYVSDDIVIDTVEVSELSEEHLSQLEADCFWCFSKLLDGIQDNYTFAQPGIQAKVNALKHLTSRIDNVLHQHLGNQHVEYLQFAFRWMNNLLMREMPLSCVIRLWDTYLSEPEGFSSFHLYMCAAFLTHFSQDLMREHDFQGLLLMLQNLPTHHWGNHQIELLVAEAFKLKYMFADAPNHLADKTPS